MKLLPLTIGLILIVIPLYLFFRRERSQVSVVEISGKKIKVEVADTLLKRQKGLMGKEELCEDCGMLFIFPTSNTHPFWMKNTHINLDIIWISKDLKIVEIVENAPKDSGEPARFRPKEKSKYVLEVNEGFVSENKVSVGDKIEIR